MASSAVINPSVGNAPFPTQGGTGASPGFDAVDFRRFWSRAYDEGVTAAMAFAVTEPNAGAAMSVTVHADEGAAFVEGDSVADQGLYYVAPHSTTIDLDITAADPTNPRIDRVILQVRDNEHDGSGSTDVRVLVLTGTPTAGATLDNLSGAAAVPDTALLLANLRVIANATQVSAGNMRDMRRFGLRDANVGDLRFSAAATPPDGWLKCEGQAINRVQYADLFDAIGTAFGSGNGSTTFNVPDLRGRSPIGADLNSGRGPVRNLGAAGGEYEHVLTESEMPSHSHTGFVHQLQMTASAGGAEQTVSDIRLGGALTTTWVDLDALDMILAIANTGGNAPHTNMHPFQVTNALIYSGVAA